MRTMFLGTTSPVSLSLVVAPVSSLAQCGGLDRFQFLLWDGDTLVEQAQGFPTLADAKRAGRARARHIMNGGAR